MFLIIMVVSEEKREEIRKDARRVLDKFSKELGKVRIPLDKEKEGCGGFREEGEGVKGDEEFRKAMFKNAPEKDGDFIVAERKKW
jgi:Asp-tRNA(Asn)/Glu-tRNA(Gln) amidotransferase C subunit